MQKKGRDGYNNDVSDMYLFYPAQFVVDSKNSPVKDRPVSESEPAVTRRPSHRKSSSITTEIILQEQQVHKSPISSIPTTPVIMATSAPPYITTTILHDSNNHHSTMSSGTLSFRNVTRPSLNSVMSNHNSHTFKLVKTGK